MSKRIDLTDGQFRAQRAGSSSVAVTFVVPVFNKGMFLDECLESLRKQTLMDSEIICINDASTDTSGEILDAHRNADARIRVFENSSTCGAGASRNVGIEMARGEFVRFVDADDLLPMHSTESMFNRALEADADIVRGSLALFRGADRDNPHSVVSMPNRRITTLRDESSLWVPWWHTSYLISRDLIRNRNLRYPNLLQGEDPVFLASVLVNAERISLIEEVVYLYRKYPKATGSSQSTFESIGAFLEHAALVKSMFTAYSPKCWYSGYGPYLFEDLQSVMKRSRVSESEMAALRAKAGSIWDDITPCSLS